MTIAAVVITKDEEKNIADCLESVRWADELIVVDAESRDRTVELAKRIPRKCLSARGPGMARKKTSASIRPLRSGFSWWMPTSG